MKACHSEEIRVLSPKKLREIAASRKDLLFAVRYLRVRVRLFSLKTFGRIKNFELPRIPELENLLLWPRERGQMKILMSCCDRILPLPSPASRSF